MNILTQIIENKKREIALQKEAVGLEQMLILGAEQVERPTFSMKNALEKSSTGIIAEFKRKSPSKGWLHPEAKIAEIVPLYEKYGAAGCSILTDTDFFGGSLKDLQEARQQTTLPLLRKDFIVDEYQLHQARVMGADIILLIASALTQSECAQLAKQAHSLGLEVLLEVHCNEELAHMNEHVDLLGINNRNLGTFETDIDQSFKLMAEIEKEIGKGQHAPLVISESGISDAETIFQLRSIGFRGFLIGETFMKNQNPGEALNRLINLTHNNETV